MIKFEVSDIKNMNAAMQDFAEFLKDGDVCEDDVFDSRLVGCELISNVLRHCGEKAVFSGVITGDEIIINVASVNSGGFVLRPALPDVFAESGRGLYIINEVSGGNIRMDDNAVIVTIKRR